MDAVIFRSSFMDEYWRLGLVSQNLSRACVVGHARQTFRILSCRYGAVYEGVDPLSPGARTRAAFVCTIAAALVRAPFCLRAWLSGASFLDASFMSFDNTAFIDVLGQAWANSVWYGVHRFFSACMCFQGFQRSRLHEGAFASTFFDAVLPLEEFWD